MLKAGSNVLMTFAWYAHLKNLAGRRAALSILGAVYFVLRSPGTP